MEWQGRTRDFVSDTIQPEQMTHPHPIPGASYLGSLEVCFGIQPSTPMAHTGRCPAGRAFQTPSVPESYNTIHKEIIIPNSIVTGLWLAEQVGMGVGLYSEQSILVGFHLGHTDSLSDFLSGALFNCQDFHMTVERCGGILSFCSGFYIS